MTETSGFSHITVHADDNDEVVIQAGVRAGAQHDEQPPAPVEPREQAHPAKPQPAPKPAAAPSAPTTAASTKKAPKGSAYHQTTAEDLETGPMPTAQKVVIVMAVLLIVGFLVYYNFLR